MVYIDDMLTGFVEAASVPDAVGQVFIVADARPVTLNELVATIARQLRVQTPRLHIPLWPVRTAARVCERACGALHVQPPIYERRVDFFRTDYAFDISKARRILNYQPAYTLEDGIAQTMRWYQHQDLL
jgi:nucleoside-diphosphate-sugar epimerase